MSTLKENMRLFVWRDEFSAQFRGFSYKEENGYIGNLNNRAWTAQKAIGQAQKADMMGKILKKGNLCHAIPPTILPKNND